MSFTSCVVEAALLPAGWSGASDIVDMMQRTLQIGTSSSDSKPPQHAQAGKELSTSHQTSQR